jgi:hypothetical protein
MIVIAKTEEDAKWLNRELKIAWDTAAIAQSSFNEGFNGNGVCWWSGEEAPDFSDVKQPYYWQDNLSNEDFLKVVLLKEAERILLEQKFYREHVKDKFKFLRFEESNYNGNWWVRINYGGGHKSAGYFFSPHEQVETMEKLKRENTKARKNAGLEKRYKFLVFGFYKKVSVWTRRMDIEDYDGRRHSGASTHFEFSYPPTKVDIKELDRLNAEAEIASDESHFFCSTCQKAYHKDDYGFFYFATKRCRKCVDSDPKWLAAAKAERYN